MAKKSLTKPTSTKTSTSKTASKKAAPTMLSPQKDESVRIERIDNGYLAVKEIYDPKKGYSTKKVFMDKNPLENL